MNENFLKQLQMLYPSLNELKIFGDSVTYKETTLDVSCFSVSHLFETCPALRSNIANISSKQFFKILEVNQRGLKKIKKDQEIEVLDMTQKIEVLTIDDEVFSLYIKENEFLDLLDSPVGYSPKVMMQINLYYIFLQELQEQRNYLFPEVEKFLIHYEDKVLELESFTEYNKNQEFAINKYHRIFESHSKKEIFPFRLQFSYGFASAIFLVCMTIMSGVVFAILLK